MSFLIWATGLLLLLFAICDVVECFLPICVYVYAYAVLVLGYVLHAMYQAIYQDKK